MDLVQGRLWDEPASPAAPKQSSARRAARASRPAVTYVAVPLFADMEEVAPSPGDLLPRPEQARSTGGGRSRGGPRAPRGTRSPEEVPSTEETRSRDEVRAPKDGRSADGARSPESGTSPEERHAAEVMGVPAPSRAAPKAVAGWGRVGAAGVAAADPGMETAAEWVEQILDEPGKAAGLVRRFVELFPPSARWESEEAPPFLPSAAGYAAALREVATGRVRVRLTGRWESGESGAVVAAKGRGDEGWSVVDREGLEP